MNHKKKLIPFLLSLIGLFLANTLLNAASANPIIPIGANSSQPTFTPAAPNINAKGYILIDADSGKVIVEKNADLHLPPASLTKLMSLYIISSALKSGAIHMDDKVRISSKAWKAEGSRMFIKVNDEVSVQDLLQGVVVDSGNDATIALAEYIASAEDAFTSMMNTQAKQLGMNNSHFTDSTGLPDPEHYSTPRDFALLTQAYIKSFPEDYHFFAQKWFAYNGIRQPNRNRLLWRLPEADGLKTGHTKDAGYCLIGSAKKNNMRLISVVMGSPSDVVRTEESIRLLNYGFRFYETHKIYGANETISSAHVWKGANKEVRLGLAEDLYLTVANNQVKNIQKNVVLLNSLKAPIEKGQTLGTLNVTINNQILASQAIIALESNPRGSLWRSMADSMGYAFQKIFSKSHETINND
ncbi:MAG TPA: D-alanyl-D-alanine carboxypeptidase family protein [Gammaproteobacteria bacterium]|nr:D-alanyl-D-alanine carboxypeptidase family protein [Gammaproteobacteria bacterium]